MNYYSLDGFMHCPLCLHHGKIIIMHSLKLLISLINLFYWRIMLLIWVSQAISLVLNRPMGHCAVLYCKSSGIWTIAYCSYWFCLIGFVANNFHGAWRQMMKNLPYEHQLNSEVLLNWYVFSKQSAVLRCFFLRGTSCTYKSYMSDTFREM